MKTFRTIAGGILGGIGFVGLMIETTPLLKVITFIVSMAFICASIALMKDTDVWNETDWRA